ncbi:MAG: hypothetical protein KDE14_14915 [Rhodobacteraceae bacterium]|nr:hypothetical protein [Paracoccaceae bacterium]
MAIEPTLESALGAQRKNLLDKIGNSAQGAQQTKSRDAAEKLADKIKDRREAENDKNELPVNPKRGRHVNFST